MKLTSKTVASEAFLNENTSAFILYSICIAEFGTQIYEWEPECLWLEIIDSFKVDAVESSKDKIQAAIALTETNSFYENFRVFEAIGKAFNDQNPDVEWVTPLTPEEASWCITEASLIDETPEKFSLEIEGYIRECLRDSGMITTPENLKFSRLGDYYRPEEYIPSELYNETMLQQKIKLNRCKAYSQMRKDKIKSDLSRYFSG